MLSYEAAGRGERTMVFLHGFGGSRGLWRQQVEKFSIDARCLTIDLPGHGESEWIPFTLKDMAQQVEEVLRKERIVGAHVVVSSFGGLVALEIWKSSPASFSAITLAGSLPRFTACDGFPAGLNVTRIRKLAGQCEGDVSAVLEIFFRSLFTMKERESEQYAAIKDLRRVSPLPKREALKAMLDILEQADLRDAFSKVSVPVQIIVGDGDPLCPLEAIEVLKAMNPSVRVDVFKSCGHFPFLSFPRKFNSMLQEFRGR